MANEKEQKNHPHLFWKILKECLRRMVTPCLMYLFMSLLLLSVQTIFPEENQNIIEIILGCICIAGGIFFNGHLCYHYGKIHYDNYLTGCIHRRNERLGIPSGGDHRPELEYRPWKGIVIGVFVALPVLIFGTLSGFYYDVAGLFFILFAGWAIIPLSWIAPGEGGQGIGISPFWSLLFAIIPIVVSAVMYNVGAMVEKRKKEEEAERAEFIQKAGKK